MNLSSAPLDVVDADGQPRFGRHLGLANAFDWSRLAPPFARSALWKRFHHKRWHYVAFTTEELFCCLAVADVGWGNNAFGYVFDRQRREVVETFSVMGMAGVSAKMGSHARAPTSFRAPGVRIAIEPVAGDSYALSLSKRGFRIEAHYGGPAPCLLAVGQPLGGSVHATQKSGALAASGFVEAGGRRYQLDGGVASFDYSNGLLARETAWRWVSAQGDGIGFNLQTGYFADNENALWIDGTIVPLGAADFEAADCAPAAWRVRDAKGMVDLRFTPEGVRRHDTRLVVASSQLVQQIGVFEGWVRSTPDAPPRPVERLVGLTEQHRARW